MTAGDRHEDGPASTPATPDDQRVRQMSIYPQYLELIAAGRKRVEVRVGYPSMRRIRPGQLLRFVSGDQHCLTRVIRVTEYPSFDHMLDHETPQVIGATGTREQTLAGLRALYPPEKEALGVLAIEIAQA